MLTCILRMSSNFWTDVVVSVTTSSRLRFSNSRVRGFRRVRKEFEKSSKKFEKVRKSSNFKFSKCSPGVLKQLGPVVAVKDIQRCEIQLKWIINYLKYCCYNEDEISRTSFFRSYFTFTENIWKKELDNLFCFWLA